MFILENIRRPLLVAFSALFTLTVAGCSGQTEAKYPSNAHREDMASNNDIYSQTDTVFGKGEAARRPFTTVSRRTGRAVVPSLVIALSSRSPP